MFRIRQTGKTKLNKQYILLHLHSYTLHFFFASQKAYEAFEQKISLQDFPLATKKISCHTIYRMLPSIGSMDTALIWLRYQQPTALFFLSVSRQRYLFSPVHADAT